MTIVIQNKFDGGHAEDIRTTKTNECEYSLNFDIISNPHLLQPYPDNIEDIITMSPPPTMDDVELSDITVGVNAGVNYLMASGKTSSSSAIISFWQKSNLTSVWGAGSSGTGIHIKGTQITYKGDTYAVTQLGSTFKLEKWTGAITTIGTSSTAVNIGSKVTTFVHPEDNVLYIINSNVILKYDGTTFSEHTTILPSGMTAVDMTSWGTYLAIAMNPTNNIGKSVVYLWGRDTSLNTLQQSITFGEEPIVVLDNLNEVLIAVMNKNFSFSSTNKYKIIVKGWSGGVVQILKSLTVNSLITPKSIKLKHNNKIYFGSNNDSNIYSFSKNNSGNYIITKDRYFTNSEASSQALGSLSVIGDVIWVGAYNSSGIWALYRTKSSGDTVTYNNNSIYRTTINTGMPIVDRYKNKQLEAVQISYTGASTGTTTLKYSVDGSTFTTIISESNTTGEQVFEATNENDGTPFLSGREFQFQLESSGGSEIKEIRYKYKVLPTTI